MHYASDKFNINVGPDIGRKRWPAKMWPANVGPQKCGPQMLARKCWPANIDPQILARSPQPAARILVTLSKVYACTHSKAFTFHYIVDRDFQYSL